MSQGPDITAAGRGAEADVLLLECDWRGQIVWMNGYMRRLFGTIQNLVDTFAVSQVPRPEPDPCSSTLCFSRVYQSDRGVLLRVTRPRLTDPDSLTMGSLEGSLLDHYFRLQNIERQLSERARRRKRGGGLAAIRQIELERQRLGRELHTGVGQMLAAIRLQLEVIGGQLSSPPPPVEQALGRISTLASDALEQVRGISRRLHPPEWQRLDLASALQQLWDVTGIPQRFSAIADLHPLFREPQLEIKTLLYRAAQEALSNVIRHAQATSVHMSLETNQNLLILTVSDNGVGFDLARQAAAPAALASGIGLRSIREQAAALGGKVVMESRPGGTKLVVSVPFLTSDTVFP